MRVQALVLLILLFAACDKNPFGDSFFSSCQHSPGGDFGLPLACPVNLNVTTDLVTWFDFNNLNTIVFNPPAKVESLPDSSGQLLSLTHKNGAKADYKTKSLNERGVISFGNTEGAYHFANPKTINNANNNLSLFSVFSLNGSSSELEIHLNSGLSLKVNAQSLQVLLNGNIKIETQSHNKRGLNRIHIQKNQNENKLYLYANSNLTESSSFADNTALLNQVDISAKSVDIGEVLIYRRIHGAKVFSAIDTYLKNKWGQL